MNNVINKRSKEMEEEKDVSAWGFLLAILGGAVAFFVILPMLLVSELSCIPECVSKFLWDLGYKLLGGGKWTE